MVGIPYKQKRNDIICRALARLRIAVDGEEPTAEMISYGTQTLDDMICSWEAEGIHIWKTTPAELICDGRRGKYVIPDAATMRPENVPMAFVDSVIQGYPVIRAANAPGSPTFVVDDNIELFGELRRIVGVVYDVEDAVDGWASLSLDQPPCSYSQCGFPAPYWPDWTITPVRLDNVRFKGTCGYGDAAAIPMRAISREEYLRMAVVDTIGVPLAYSTLRRDNSLELSVWPYPTPGVRILMDITPRFDLTENSTDRPDFPREWTECLIANLAAKLTDKYGASDNLKARLEASAARELDRATRGDMEYGASISFALRDNED
ncbi:hypothetical protein FACS1894186_4870 [Alphaproteobacteria bacterium]|nr:hypothetical protein FACS1894186_4870 [Alphaproteobacteria bacterium]